MSKKRNGKHKEQRAVQGGGRSSSAARRDGQPVGTRLNRWSRLVMVCLPFLAGGTGAGSRNDDGRKSVPKSASRSTANRRRFGAALVLALIVCSIASSGILARRGVFNSLGSSSKTAGRGLQSATPTPTPNKEYIYAGGKLIATEEPGGNPPPPNGPSITGVSPTSGIANGQSFLFTINGNNLSAATAIVFSPPADFDIQNFSASSTSVTAMLTIKTDVPTGVPYTVSVTIDGQSCDCGSPTFTVNPEAGAPGITGITPNSAPQGAVINSLAITGQNFSSPATITFTGPTGSTTDVQTQGAVSYTPPSGAPTQISAEVLVSSTAVVGNYLVTVNMGGQTASTNFQVTSGGGGPVLKQINPKTGVPGDQFPMTLTGTGLSGVTQVVFTPTSGQSNPIIGATQVTSSSTSVTAQISISEQESTAGNYNVYVINTAQVQSSPMPFTVLSTCANLPTPNVTGISTGTTGNPQINQSFTLTVNGSGSTFFQGTSTIYVGGIQQTTQFVSANQLTCSLNYSQAGNYSVVVINSTNVTSCATPSSGSFNLEVDNPFPSLSSITPATIPAGSSATQVAVSGSGFYSGSVVQLNGSPRPTALNSGQLTATLSAADLASPASYTVTVVNAGPGGGTAVNAPTLLVVGHPSISGISASSTTAPAGNLPVTISGANFRSSDPVTVQLNGGTTQGLTGTFGSGGTSISVTVPSSLTAAGGVLTFNVTDTFFSQTVSGNLTINNPAPVVTGLSTTSLTQGTTSPAFVISGSGFVSSSASPSTSSVVQINGVACGCTTAFSTTSTPQTITVTLTSAEVSSVVTDSITVMNPAPGGGTSNSEMLNILPPPPGAPTGLTATAVSATQINLAWINSSTNATSITIQRSTAGGAYTSLTPTISGTATTYTDSNLSPDTQYSYQIFATNAGGSSPDSNQFTATTWATPPAVPSGLTATLSSSSPSSEIDLTWTDNNPNETGIKIERETGSGGFSVVAVLCPNTTSYPDKNLTQSTQYTYRIGSFNSAGDSGYSAPAPPVTTQAQGQPAAPSSLTAIAETGPSVLLQWHNNAVSQTGIIVLEWHTNTGYTPLIQLTGSPTSYTVTGLAPNMQYCFEVEAVNGPLTSVPTSPTCVTTGFSVLEPSVDDELHASHLRGLYAYLRDTGEDAPWRAASPLLIANAGGPMVANGVYYSTLASEFSLAGNPPAAPIGLVAWPIGGAQINLSWVPGDSTQNGFTLQRATSVSGPFTTVASIDNCASMFTYTDTGLASSTTYYYQVFATSILNGSSGSSNVAGASTDNTPTITYISPSYVLKGTTTPFTLTVNGSNFNSSSVVQVGGSAHATTLANGVLSATLTSADLGTAAQLAITVANTSPSSSVSNTQTLNVVANNTPTITSLSVPSLMEGSPAFDLTVNGTGFVTGSTVKIGGSARTTTFYGPNELVAWIPASDLVTAANLAVTVANPSPGTTSSSSTLAVTNPMPQITSINPTTTATGAQFSLTVTGTNFVNGSVIMVGTHSVTATFNPSTPTVLTATVPGSDIPTAATVNVTVVNSGPGGGASNAIGLTVTNQAPPTVTGVTAMAESNSSIQLSWSPTSGATGYTVYWVTQNGPTQIGTTTGGSATTYLVTGLSQNTNYCYEVKATNSFGSSASYSTQACATTPF